VERGKKGAIWQRCLEPLAMAQLAWPDDEQLQKDMGDVCLPFLSPKMPFDLAR
jgi:hypothetical protein